MKLFKQNETVNGDLSVSQDRFIIKNCNIDGDLRLTGAKNCLVAQTEITGSIYLEDCFNCTVILCSAFELYATGCNNLFIIGNNCTGGITFTENTHLIADKNTPASPINCNL